MIRIAPEAVKLAPARGRKNLRKIIQWMRCCNLNHYTHTCPDLQIVRLYWQRSYSNSVRDSVLWCTTCSEAEQSMRLSQKTLSPLSCEVCGLRSWKRLQGHDVCAKRRDVTVAPIALLLALDQCSPKRAVAAPIATSTRFVAGDGKFSFEYPDRWAVAIVCSLLCYNPLQPDRFGGIPLTGHHANCKIALMYFVFYFNGHWSMFSVSNAS